MECLNIWSRGNGNKSTEIVTFKTVNKMIIKIVLKFEFDSLKGLMN